MGAMIVWRDDDVLMYGTIDDLLRVDDVFQRHGAVHTVAVIVKSLDDALARAIVDRGMDAQLHGYWHDDFSDRNVVGLNQLPMAADIMERMLGQRPRIIYPPWNRNSEKLERMAASLGMRVSHQVITLQQYIKARGRVPEGTVVNFHYWANDPVMIDQALQIARG